VWDSNKGIERGYCVIKKSRTDKRISMPPSPPSPSIPSPSIPSLYEHHHHQQREREGVGGRIKEQKNKKILQRKSFHSERGEAASSLFIGLDQSGALLLLLTLDFLLNTSLCLL
jgi:hypothetical protein